MTFFGYDKDTSLVLLTCAVASGFLVGMLSMENLMPTVLQLVSADPQIIMVDNLSCRPMAR